MTKKYQEAKKLITKLSYSLDEALELLPQLSKTKFDPSVEVHLSLNINPEKPEHQIRAITNLPHGTGRSTKIAVFCEPEKEKEAKEAGADFVGEQELIDKVEKGFLEFDVVIATPKTMPKLGKLGKILGTKGLMPNPKTGTITNELEKLIKQIKSGRIEFRTDKFGNIHQAIGKLSFGKEKLKENFIAFLNAVNAYRPSGIKGKYIKSITLCTTMSPGIKLDQAFQK